MGTMWLWATGRIQWPSSTSGECHVGGWLPGWEVGVGGWWVGGCVAGCLPGWVGRGQCGQQQHLCQGSGGHTGCHGTVYPPLSAAGALLLVAFSRCMLSVVSGPPLPCPVGLWAVQQDEGCPEVPPQVSGQRAGLQPRWQALHADNWPGWVAGWWGGVFGEEREEGPACLPPE